MSDEGNTAEERAGDEPRWDVRWIMDVLPHRYPFLLVDRVLELVPGERIVAIKNVTVNEEFFVGHFPGNPVMPGVLLVEGMAQAGGILLLHDRGRGEGEGGGKETVSYLVGIDKARFRRPVVPGDQVRFEVEVQRLRQSHSRMACKALVDGELAAEAIVSTAVVER